MDGEASMRTVALVDHPSETLGLLRAALPAAEFLHLTFEEVECTAAARRLSAVVIGAEALRGRGAARVAVLVLRHPELATVALLPPTPKLPHNVFALGHAGVDALVIAGTEDHPDRLRETFAHAALASVARVVERAPQPAVPLLAAPNVLPALTGIRALRGARDLAAAIGVRLATLRTDLLSATSVPPKRLLAFLRVLVAGRHLGDTTDTVEWIACAAGYGSARAFEKACQDFLHASPHDVRAGGGLWFASSRFHQALEEHRAA
ncbi:MAG: helix-turn-helix domain-containing protein [Armatimonadota bacterium]